MGHNFIHGRTSYKRWLFPEITHALQSAKTGYSIKIKKPAQPGRLFYFIIFFLQAI
jgi:hypothetical protein